MPYKNKDRDPNSTRAWIYFWVQLVLIIITLLAFIVIVEKASAQDISAYYRMTTGSAPLYKWLRIDSPLRLNVDTTGPHLSLDPAALGIAVTLDNKPLGTFPALHFWTGYGISVIASPEPNNSAVALQVVADTAILSYRTEVPAGPGPCTDEGAGAWAVDKTGFYFCIGDNWARLGPVQTDWSDTTRSAGTVPVAVVNEMPLQSPFAPQAWILIRKPIGPVICTIDGAARTDFAMAGANVLASATWPPDVGLPSSRLRCSYSYLPADQ